MVHLSTNDLVSMQQMPPNAVMHSRELDSTEQHDPVVQDSQTTASVSNSPERLFTEDIPSSPDRIPNDIVPCSKAGRSGSMGSDIATSDLQYIAAELSCLKPKKHSAVEEAELVKDDHQITLGSNPNESTGTNRSHRRPMSLNLPRVLPLKPLEPTAHLETGPNRSPSNKASPSASPSKRRNSIPSDTDMVTSKSELPSNPVGKSPSMILLDDANIPEKPINSPIVEIRSSEQEPSVHQTNIPTLNHFLFPARLCYMLDSYRQIDQNFDLHCLVGIKRYEIESYLRQDVPLSEKEVVSPKLLESEKIDSPAFKRHLSPQQITPAHKPILENFLKCSSSDLVLEGFYHELALEGPKRNGRYDSTSEKSTQDRMEVAIFSSDYHRQFLVVYQGSVDMQAKSIWNQNDHKVRGSSQESILCDEQPVTVFTPFKNAYHESNLEGKVFQKLDELIQTHPFFDVVITGFSFGGSLASIASMRYAEKNPMLLISCFTFGCPKIGALNYRYYVNSLPNLKVMRLECKKDTRSYFPDNAIWTHAGHAIVIDVVVPISLSLDTSKDQPESIKAYKFGQHRPTLSVGKKVGSVKLFSLFRNHAMKDLHRNEYNIATYILAIERMATLGLPWPCDFVGEDQQGVSGIDDEKRNDYKIAVIQLRRL